MEFKAGKKIRNCISGIGAVGWIVIILVMLLSYKTAFDFLKSRGIVISVTPQRENGESIDAGTISIRGATIDKTWYDPENLYVSGNWTLDPVHHIYASVDTESIKLKVPYAEKINLVFDIGPDKGQAVIRSGKFVRTYNCNHAETIPLGWGCEFSNKDLGLSTKLTMCRLAAVAISILAGIMVLMLCRMYKEQRHRDRIEIAYILLLLPAVVLFLSYFSVSSSPLVPEAANYWGEDGSVYNLLGKACAQGKIPYVDIWEQKGPIIFLIYGLGYLLNSNWGVFFFQVIFVYSSFVLSYYIGKTIGEVSTGIVASLATFLYYVLVMDEGALIEDFNLPILMLSMLLTIKYVQKAEENVCFPPKYAAVYGAAVGISLGLRVTNCVSVCVFTFCFVIYLLVKKQFKNLFQNAIAFLLGFAGVVVPFLIYFAVHCALYDLLFGTILFSFQYTKIAVQTGHSVEQLLKMGLYMMPAIMCIILSLEQKKIIAVPILLSAVANIFMFSRLYFFPHYYIILLIYVPVVVGWTMQTHTCGQGILNRYKISYFLLSAFILCGMWRMTYNAGLGHYNWVKILRNTQEESVYVQKVKQQAALIPEEDRDSVTGYGVGAKWFLITDITPSFKYYSGVEWVSRTLGEARQEWIDYYSSLSAKWIVVQGKNMLPDIQNIIKANYELYNSVDFENGAQLNLYKLR